MLIIAAADHRGYQLKDAIVARLREAGHDVTDAGTSGPELVDYPDIALTVGKEIQDSNAERGVIICGSGVGAVIAANKLRGVRAGICHDTYSAHQGVEHDDMNVLCLGSDVIGRELALQIVDVFVAARFRDEGRYRRRLDKVRAMEAGAPLAAPTERRT